MNERILALLNALKDMGIKQYTFAETLGVTETAVSAWKNGRRNITEQTIKAICREFNVNYLWLTTGEGEMFVDNDDDTVEMIDRVMFGESEFHKNLFKTFAKLDKTELEVLESIINKYIDIVNNQNEKADD